MVNEAAYADALDDVHTRFILNLPPSELTSPDRIFFQLEQAWWFYDDFICDNSTEDLPRFKHVKPFSLKMFEFSPLLQPLLPKFHEMYAKFSEYKRSISTYGTILLNADATKLALCRNWNGKSWTLPGGKVNQNESGKDAAARETYEETGFDPYCERGLCAKWKERRERGEVVPELADAGGEDGGLVPFFVEEAVNINAASDSLLPWETLQDSNKLVSTEKDTNKRRTCFVCRGVPENFPFEPVARKEVSEVKFFDLNNLPKHNYAVLPFMGHLKKWIRQDNKRRARGNQSNERSSSRTGSRPKSRGKNQDDRRTTPNRKERSDSQPKSHSSPKKEKKPSSRTNSKQKPRSNSKEVAYNDPLVSSALASPGESNRWTEEEMFATNEKILGRKITYSGNPHEFAEKGFGIEGSGQRLDPHAFHVVGGKFMNSDKKMLAPPPRLDAMQPLVARNRNESGEFPDDEMELTPFFSDGKAPWEEGAAASLGGLMDRLSVKQEEEQPVRSAGSNSKGLALLSRLRQGGSANDFAASADQNESNAGASAAQNFDWFLTDKEITAKSQKEKLCSMLDVASPSLEPSSAHHNEQSVHFQEMKSWVASLQRAPPTKYFGDFRFDVDAIMNAMNKVVPNVT